MQLPKTDVKEVAVGVDHAIKQSFTDSINTTFLMSALIGAAAVGVAFLFPPRRRVLTFMK